MASTPMDQWEFTPCEDITAFELATILARYRFGGIPGLGDQLLRVDIPTDDEPPYPRHWTKVEP